MTDSLERVFAGSFRTRLAAPVARREPSGVLSPVPLGAPSDLRGIVEAEIVPRLVGAHAMRSRPPIPRRPARVAPSLLREQDVSDLAMLSMTDDVAAAIRFVEDRCRLGIPLDVLYLDLLSPAARTLGVLWERDLCSFADVTVGLGVVHGVMHAFSPRFVQDAGVEDPRRSVLLVGAPGEQHSFGVHMVAEFFRRAGWAVRTEHPTSVAACGEMAAEGWYGVIGVSSGSTVKLDTVTECIRIVRRRSVNPDVAVLVGGPLFAVHPECARVVGADASTADGSQVPELAERFIARMPART